MFKIHTMKKNQHIGIKRMKQNKVFMNSLRTALILRIMNKGKSLYMVKKTIWKNSR